MRRPPNVIRVGFGRRTRAYGAMLPEGQMQCAFCLVTFRYEEYPMHIGTCSDHPMHVEPRSPRTGETPEQILARLAARLNCEPRQVCDRVIRMLEDRQRERS